MEDGEALTRALALKTMEAWQRDQFLSETWIVRVMCLQIGRYALTNWKPLFASLYYRI